MHRLFHATALLLAAVLGMDAALVQFAHTCGHHDVVCVGHAGIVEVGHSHGHAGHSHCPTEANTAEAEAPESRDTQPRPDGPEEDSCAACRYLCEAAQPMGSAPQLATDDAVTTLALRAVEVPVLETWTGSHSRAPPCSAA